MLSICRKAIFEQGQGVDPDPHNFGNSSGVALKFMYSLLELKAGIMETEFRLGFNKFVRLICNYLDIEVDNINQTWNRTAVTNDSDLVAMAKDSVGIVSNKTIIKNHPFVEDLEVELEQIRKEKEESIKEFEEGLFEKEIKEINKLEIDADKAVNNNNEKD